MKINSSIYKDKIAAGHSVTANKSTSTGNLKETYMLLHLLEYLKS